MIVSHRYAILSYKYELLAIVSAFHIYEAKNKTKSMSKPNVIIGVGVVAV